MSKWLIQVIVCFVFGKLFAQNDFPQKLHFRDLEAFFFQNNYQLIASKFNVNIAEAQQLQAKLLYNPTLTIHQINFWSNNTIESMPNLIGNFGSRQQFGVDLSQRIEAASKRKRRIAYFSTEIDKATLLLEETTRRLNFELKLAYIELCGHENYQNLIQDIVNVSQELAQQLKELASQNKIPQSQYYRIHAAIIEWQTQAIENQSKITENVHDIRVLTQLPNLKKENIYIPDLDSIAVSYQLPDKSADFWLENNLQIKLKNNEIIQSEKSILLEKANRFPDVEVLFTYDRGGSVMLNFVGFGVAFDLPIFNRNQGNAKIAHYQLRQNQLEQQETVLNVQNEIEKLSQLLMQYRQAMQSFPMSSNDDAAIIIKNFSQQYLDKQITLFEFIDIAEAYLIAQHSYLNLKTKYLKTFAELEYTLGVKLSD